MKDRYNVSSACCVLRVRARGAELIGAVRRSWSPFSPSPRALEAYFRMSQARGNEMPKIAGGAFLADRAVCATQPFNGLCRAGKINEQPSDDMLALDQLRLELGYCLDPRRMPEGSAPLHGNGAAPRLVGAAYVRRRNDARRRDNAVCGRRGRRAWEQFHRLVCTRTRCVAFLTRSLFDTINVFYWHHPEIRESANYVRLLMCCGPHAAAD